MPHYTDEQRAEVDRLLTTIQRHHVPMAVVDYLGSVKSFHPLVYTGEDDPERFGVRDMRHVRIYALTVVKSNLMARQRCDHDWEPTEDPLIDRCPDCGEERA